MNDSHFKSIRVFFCSLSASQTHRERRTRTQCIEEIFTVLYAISHVRNNFSFWCFVWVCLRFRRNTFYGHEFDRLWTWDLVSNQVILCVLLYSNCTRMDVLVCAIISVFNEQYSHFKYVKMVFSHREKKAEGKVSCCSSFLRKKR